MFVSDSTLLMGTKLRIMSGEGQVWEAQLEQNTVISQVKQLALDKFHPSGSSTTSGSRNTEDYRLIHPEEFRTLNEYHSIQDEKLNDNDILVLIRRRPVPGHQPLIETQLKAPTMEEITKATSHLTPVAGSSVGHNEPTSSTASANGPSHDAPAWPEVDFHLELRKIVISLISVLTTLIGTHPEVSAICNDMYIKVKNRIANTIGKPIEGTSFEYPPPPDFDSSPQGLIVGLLEARKREFRPNLTALEALKTLGFKEAEIIDALRATKNVKTQAAMWLGGKDRVIPDDSVTGLEPKSRFFLALVGNPTIRLGLTHPKTLMAFLGIVESPASANLWLNDPETSVILSAIFKLYHAEKHNLTATAN